MKAAGSAAKHLSRTSDWGSVRASRRTPRRPKTSRRGSPGTVEHFLKQNAGAIAFAGVTLSVFASKKFHILPAAMVLMMAQEKLGIPGLERVARAIRS